MFSASDYAGVIVSENKASQIRLYNLSGDTMGKYASCPCAKGECDVFCGICNTSTITFNISSYGSQSTFILSPYSQ